MIHLAAQIIDQPEEHLKILGLSTLFVLLAALVLHHGVELPFLKTRGRLLKDA